MAKKSQDTRKKRRVFLSFASSDLEHARYVRNILAHMPDVAVLDPHRAIKPGEKIDSSMRKLLVGSDLFVLILSKKALDSPHVLHELGAAWALEKPILPLLIGRLEADAAASLRFLSDRPRFKLNDLTPDLIHEAMGQAA